MHPRKPRSFLVRVLPERPATGVDAPLWRGYAVELPDGRERWFEDLGQLPALIAALLDGDASGHGEHGTGGRG